MAAAATSACVTPKVAAANNYASRAPAAKEVGTYTALVGPIVSFQALGVAQVWKIKA